jgi:putative peptide zinc metalloprotease protein
VTAPTRNDAIVPPPLRSDLSSTPRRYLGRNYVIYKNPISLAFFRLPAVHAEAACEFDGAARLGGIARKLRQTSRYWTAMAEEQAVEELAALAMQLSQAGLLQVRASGATERGRRLRELKSQRAFETAVSQVMFFRKSLYDPDRLLAQLLPFVNWIYRRGVLIFLAAFVVFTLLAALWNIRSVAAHGANFFTLSNLGLTWVLFIGVKILHEFGHGLTAKRFGAEVHEMGFMFILFTPYLFCNVSDVWRAGKTARIATGSAGLVVEMVLAATAFWFWMATQPGLFHQMCYNTMILCSVSTLLFNGNPLMKFDGYYILSDYLEIPNLRAKSNAWVTGWAQRRLLGMPATRAAAPNEASPFFGLYAVAAYLYGWFIVFSISALLFDMLKPYGLEFISRTYVALFLFVSLGLPFYRLVRSVHGSVSVRAILARRSRWVVAGAGLLAAAAFLVPWSENIRRSAALEHARVAAVSSSAPGVLVEVLVGEGDKVAAGQALGRLRNPDLEAQLASARTDREALQVRLRALAADSGEEARLALPVAMRQLRELEEQMAGLESKVASLELTSPFDGVVRTARVPELAGRFFAAGQPIIEVGAGGDPKLLIALDEQEARKLRSGQIVRAVFAGLPGEVFRGEISSVPVSPAPQFSADSMSNLLGGDFPSESAPGGRPAPSVGYFEAEAVLHIPQEKLELLRARSAARARIEVRRTSLAGWLRDRAYEMINPEIRL